MRVLITGVASPRAWGVATRLAARGHEVVGIDKVLPEQELPELTRQGVEVEAVDLRKRGFEEKLRVGGFSAILHMAVHAGFRMRPAERHRVNIEGTHRVIALAARHGVRRLVVASHAAVYGALPDNPYFMTEEAPPAVGRSFPEMQDLVTADLLAGAEMWKHPELSMVVLRPVHVLGPSARGVIASLLRLPRFPMVIGFDPLLQVIHEEDYAEAFVLALGAALGAGDQGDPPGEELRGCYNVAGPGALPLSVLVREAGRRALPFPAPVFPLFRGRFGFPKVSSGALDFLRHPCLVDDARFRAATGFVPRHDLRSTVESMRY